MSLKPPISFTQALAAREGIIAVDKPSGISSHSVVNWARSVFGVKKIGHTGTLDPLASGLLLLLVGRNCTKLQPDYLKLDKTYEVTARVGICTGTYDAMGIVTQTVPWNQVVAHTDAELEAGLKSFVGVTQQTVPAFSAVKQGGKKLYELAVKDTATLPELPVRTVVIDSIVVTNIARDTTKKELLVTFLVACGSGTYIRSLVHDWGALLGSGAMVQSLRRIQIGPFLLDESTICPFVPRRFFFRPKEGV